MSAWQLPPSISKLTPSSASTPGKRLRIFWNEMPGMTKSIKHQIPNTKLQRSSNLQSGRSSRAGDRLSHYLRWSGLKPALPVLCSCFRSDLLPEPAGAVGGDAVDAGVSLAAGEHGVVDGPGVNLEVEA